MFFPINIVILDAIVLKINLIPAKKAEIKDDIKIVEIKPVFITKAIATFAPLLIAFCKNSNEFILTFMFFQVRNFP